MNIQWIFFDIGGVLGDESEFLSIRQQYNLEVIKQFKQEATKEEVLNIWPKASAMIGDLDANVVTIALEKSGGANKAIGLMRERRSQAPDYYSLLKIRPDASEVIPVLSKKYKLAILANQNTQARSKLEEFGLLQYFQKSIVSRDINLSKPDPRFFEKIFEVTGADPKGSIMVDDNIERGLVTAKRLGMVTVWYKNQERQDVPKGVVDHTITSLRQLLELF